MARPETLIPGNCYFYVAFYDDKLLLPVIDTLIYVGQGQDQDGRLWLFKEPDSPPSPDEQDAVHDPPALTGFSDKQLHQIVDFDGLMQRIREIAVDHPLTPIARRNAERAGIEDYVSVSVQVDRFLSDTAIVSLTMTIRFTDDGLSLGRDADGYHMTLYTHPRRDPEEESRILLLFASRGAQPTVNHLFDGGRTRTLQFSIASERNSIVDLCTRVLDEVHSMRKGDVLDYYPLKKSDIEDRG